MVTRGARSGGLSGGSSFARVSVRSGNTKQAVYRALERGAARVNGGCTGLVEQNEREREMLIEMMMIFT